MKKILIIMLLMLYIISLDFSVYAVNSNERIEMDEGVENILSSQLTSEEVLAFKNTENYDETLGSVNLSEYVMLRKYRSAYWELANVSLSERLQKVNSAESGYASSDYFVFAETPFVISKSNNGISSVIGINNVYDYVPIYISDIQNMNISAIMNGKKREVKEIYCFDGSSSHEGILVYFQTNSGIYVKYYEDWNSEAVLFSEEQFVEYASAYYEYITSYEYNYTPSGEPLNGGNITLTSFISEIYREGESNGNNKMMMLGIIGGALIMVVAISIVRKKLKNRSCQIL